jgi:hypothetical protein
MAALQKQRAIDKKREENAKDKEAKRLLREIEKLQQWKLECSLKKPTGPTRTGPIRSVLAAPKTTSTNPLEEKRAENIASRDRQRLDRFEENRQLVNQLPTTTLTGTTEQALISGAMSVFWHAKSTSGPNAYDVYGADEDEEQGEGAQDRQAASSVSPQSSAYPLSPSPHD